MREFINIVEAKKPVPAQEPPSEEALAHTLYVRANEASVKIGQQEYTIRAGWNPEWAKMLTTVIEEVKNEHEKLQSEEKDYDPDHVAVPFSIKNALPRALEIMWNKVIEPMLNQASNDISYDKKDYQKHHPYVELSDEMELRNAENRMVNNIRRKALFDMQGMIDVCKEIDWFAEDAARLYDRGLRLCSPSTQEFIVRALPFMLVIAKVYGAGK